MFKEIQIIQKKTHAFRQTTLMIDHVISTFYFFVLSSHLALDQSGAWPCKGLRLRKG